MTHLLNLELSLFGLFPLKRIVLFIAVMVALHSSLRDTTQEWSTFHYYLGAKYFTELGYFELYECSISSPVQRRDLDTYDFRFDPPDCDAQFTFNRFLDFHRDLHFVGFEHRFMVDKGFNGSPLWITLGQFLIDGGLANPHNLWVFDVIALMIALGVSLWAVGWERTGYLMIFILTFYGTTERFWGHYAHWIWLSLVIIGVCLIHKEKLWGGAILGAGAVMSVFPVVLILYYVRNKKVLTWWLVGGCFSLIISLGNSRGLEAYPEFMRDMMIHSNYVRTEQCCNIGLAHTLTNTVHPSFDYLDCFTSETGCQATYPASYPMGAWAVFALPLLVTPLGIMYAFITLSQYYYLILAVVPVWYGMRWTRGLLLVNALVIAWAFYDQQTAYMLRHWLWYVYFLLMGVKQIYDWQATKSMVGTVQSGSHPQVATGDVGDPIR